MARRGKESLTQLVLESLAAAGWALERLTPNGTHPARFTMTRGSERLTVKLYIWNLSHGGKGRSKDEYRIQVTGVEQFEPEPGGHTLILGWDDQLGLFAGFDVMSRLGRIGSSPSIQIQAGSLERAREAGASLQAKRDGEYAVAVRPDLIGQYVAHLKEVHAGEISLLLEGQGRELENSEVTFEHIANSDVTFDFNRPGANDLRWEVREKSEELLAALEPDPVGREHIGANFPPEPIDDDVGALKDSLREIVHETSEPTPDGKKLATSGSVLSRFFDGLKVARDEGKQLLEKGKDLAREHIATIVISSIVAGAKHVPDLLSALIDLLLKWLRIASGL